ncbi:hypothetical protein ABZP36_012884 [Zizania latifolia]
MANPAFTAELDVSLGSSYGRFISGVRDQLVRHAGATRHLELVVLPLQEDEPRDARWFDVVLRCSSTVHVLLRVRADNLYIRGYRSPAGRWWEFRGGAVIDGSTPFGFNDSYGGMERTAKEELGKVTLGKEELEAAVRQLADPENDAGSQQKAGIQKKTASSLMIITMMICEAIRFRSAAGVLGYFMCNPARHGTLPEHMIKQVKNWGSLSANWLGAVFHGQTFQPLQADGSEPLQADGSQQDGGIPQHLLAPANIDCQDHAMKALGVVLNRRAELHDKHGDALDAHWRTVRAQARRLDRKRN